MGGYTIIGTPENPLTREALLHAISRIEDHLHAHGYFVEGINLSGITITEHKIYFSGSLKRANFSQANMRKALLMECELEEADFTETNLHDVDSLIHQQQPAAHAATPSSNY